MTHFIVSSSRLSLANRRAAGHNRVSDQHLLGQEVKAICRAAEDNNPAIHGGRPIDPGDDIVFYLGGVGLRPRP